MASLGAKIMQPISLQDAMINDIDINVRSTFINSNGTKISNNQQLFNKNPITGIAFTKNEAKITLIGVMDRPGTAASIFKPLADNQINVDMVVQTSSPDGGQTDITFTIIKDDVKNCIKILKENKKISYKKIIHNDKVSKVSIVGAVPDCRRTSHAGSEHGKSSGTRPSIASPGIVFRARTPGDWAVQVPECTVQVIRDSCDKH